MGVFRLTTSTIQSIPSNTETGVNFGATVFDPDGATSAPGICIVPAAWNGLYGQFSASVQIVGIGEVWLLISRSTNDGSTWTPYISGDYVTSTQTHFTKGPWLPLITGDQYRLTYYGDAETIATGGVNFFCCEAVDTTPILVGPASLFKQRAYAIIGTPSLLAFRAVKSATTQSFGAAAEVVFDSEVFDTSNSFAANRYTVDAAHNGYYLKFQAGVLCDNFENHNISLEVSTDGGTGWTEVVVDGDGTNENLNLTSGPLVANTGDIYRIVYQLVSGATIMQNDPRTFFSGYGFRP